MAQIKRNQDPLPIVICGVISLFFKMVCSKGVESDNKTTKVDIFRAGSYLNMQSAAFVLRVHCVHVWVSLMSWKVVSVDKLI
eukprot:1948009-Amphidinium_carterae.1